jgi:hypothetical protein
VATQTHHSREEVLKPVLERDAGCTSRSCRDSLCMACCPMSLATLQVRCSAQPLQPMRACWLLEKVVQRLHVFLQVLRGVS